MNPSLRTDRKPPAPKETLVFDEDCLIRQNLIDCLKFTRGSISRTARLIGLDRKTIHRRIKMWNLDLSTFRIQEHVVVSS